MRSRARRRVGGRTIVAGLACAGLMGCSGPDHNPTETVTYRPLVEPFSVAEACVQNGDNVEMMACILQQVRDADQEVDALQRKQFETARSADTRNQLLADNTQWLRDRSQDCTAVARLSGIVDRITFAQCLLEASTDRVQRLTAPAAVVVLNA